MSTLRLRLAGPLQSWGSASRFTRRETDALPTKSGILGLIAAAQGRRRSDPIEDLVGLQLAVRADQQGTLLRDFHTAHHQITGDSMPLTERSYWSDAVFTAHIGGPDALIDGIAEAIDDPRFPLALGRRSCVPSGRLVLDVTGDPVAASLTGLPWQAGIAGVRDARRRRRETVRLAVRADVGVLGETAATIEVNDVPVSFDPEHRRYRSRMVVDSLVAVPTGVQMDAPRLQGHDPMAELGGIA